ncbi:MAG: B12-binding domain-containing radical SAM protein [Candidatus Brocadiales bacterium]
MKVLFIYPNINAQVGFNYGLASISAVLKEHGHTTRLLNLNEKLNKLPSDAEIKEYIRDYAPGLIGMSVVTPQYPTALRIARLIKKDSPDTPIIIGGVHPTLVPDEVLREDCFDYACVGEGEEAVLGLVTRMESGEDTAIINNIWAKTNGKIKQNIVRSFVDLSKLPRKDYELFDLQHMIHKEDGWVRLMGSRGCPFRCSYCFNHKIVDRYREELSTSDLGYIRRHNLKDVLDEIDYLLGTYQGIKTFIFDDDIFTFDKGFLRGFCAEYHRLTKVPFVVNAHVRAFDEERARMLKEGGCSIVKFGLESGSERVRREVLRRPMSNEEIIRAFDAAHKYGLHTSAFVMIGLPYEAKKDVMATVELLGRIRPGRFRWAIFFPFPRTDAYDMSVRGGYLNFEKMRELENFTESSCLDFGPEHNLFISKLQKTLPWYVNTHSGNSVGNIYSFLTRAIEDMSPEKWEEAKDSIISIDGELSQCLNKAGCEYYSFRYNTFTAVRSDWENEKCE